MKNAPRTPPKAPSIIKLGMSDILYGYSLYDPNLIRPAFITKKSPLSFIVFRIFKTNVLTLEQKNIFHISPKDQNVLGLVIS